MSEKSTAAVNPARDPAASAFKANPDIDGLIIQGSVWLFGLKMAARLTSFGSTLILARLLVPSDFGTLGIALLAVTLLEVFSQTGFDSALIQRKGDITEFLDAAWTISVFRGIVLFLLLYWLAPVVAGFFNAPRSQDILRVLAFAPILSGFGNVGMVFFRKEMDFKQVFIYEIGGNVANAVVAVSFALVYRNVWALACGFMASRLVTVLLSYVLHPYRPRFDFNLARAKDLFNFGKWILGTQVILFFVNRGDNFFIGKFLGPVALGLYGMAFNIAYLSFTEVTQVFFKVMFPAYAKIQGNAAVLAQTYQKTIQLLAFLALPFACAVLLFSPDFTRLVLGEKWLPMVRSLQILSFSAACLSIGGSTGNLLIGIGKPSVVMHFVSIRLLILGALIYPCTSRWGIEGTALAVLASGASIGVAQIFWGVRESRCSIKEVLFDLAVPLAGVAAGSSLVLLVRGYFDRVGFVSFGVLILVFLATYACLCYLAERTKDYRAFTRLRTVFLKMVNGRVGGMSHT